MNKKDIDQFIDEMPDEVLSTLQFSMPWQGGESDLDSTTDGDGVPTSSVFSATDTIATAQTQVWTKFYENPQLNTSVRGQVGRLTGKDFECSSEIPEIHEVLKSITFDWRNRLYDNWPKYVGHSIFNCELLLNLTVHPDGFIEVDFVDSKNVAIDDIAYHSTKSNFPLFYVVKSKIDDQEVKKQIPSVYVAKYPELFTLCKEHPKYSADLFVTTAKGRAYKKLSGCNQFIVQWNRGFGIKRSIISHLVTIIKWLNHYENLKQYEIDHKKSSGAYVWIFRITDAKSFKIWMKMTDDERRKTGIMAKKTPGSSLVLPPGIEVDVKNPNLSKITDQDNDILEMVSSGLNEPGDVMTGSSKGTFASVSATRAPMSDRISDEIASFERFLKYDFWHSVLFLRSKVLSSFKFEYKVEDVIGFKKGKEIFKNIIKPAYELVDINFPVSQMIDFEAITKGLLGVKHGPISETLGISNKEIAKRLGINNYGRMRQKHALEKKKYPELVYAVDAESLQETIEGESPKKDTTE